MSNYNDLTNKKFGLLTVLARVGTSKNRNPLWLCLCGCGNISTVQTNHLKEGHTISCGCVQRKKAKELFKDYWLGKRFGKLVVVEISERRLQKCVYCICKCDCGNITTVFSKHLGSGHTKSCGCLRVGENNINWNGGSSFEPYSKEWTKSLKKYIKQRDNYVCRNPYCYGGSKHLSIHHIDYNKQNCDNSNLVTLCTGCNVRANTNRRWHQQWYEILNRKRFLHGN